MPEVWLVIGEGNAKTTLIAGVALYEIEHRPHINAPVPVAASSRDQAGELFQQAAGFVERTPRLHRIVKVGRKKKPLFECQEGYRRIKYSRGRSRIQICAADENTGDGKIYKRAVVEELHRHKDLGLYRTWRGKRDKLDGQIIAISTAGEPGSDFEQNRTRILEATPVIERRRCFVRARSAQIAIHDYAIPEDGDPEDLKLVKEANPLSTITVESLREKRATPTMVLSHWRRLTCNRATRSEDAAISDVEWANGATDARIPDRAEVDLGLDAAWKWDTFAMIPLWLREAGRKLLGAATILVPPRDGNSLDPKLVKAALRAIHARNPIRRVVMDITHANDIAAWIKDPVEGLGVPVVEHGQSDHQQAVDYDRFMEGLRNGSIRHSADAGLTEHAMNAVAKPLGSGKYKFDRKSSSRDPKQQERRVIDALAAAAMVVAENAAPAKRPNALPPLGSFATASDRARPVTAGLLGRSF